MKFMKHEYICNDVGERVAVRHRCLRCEWSNNVATGTNEWSPILCTQLFWVYEWDDSKSLVHVALADDGYSIELAYNNETIHVVSRAYFRSMSPAHADGVFRLGITMPG